MKHYFHGWWVFFVIMGVLSVLGAVGMLALVQFAAAIGLAVSALGMFMTASVCSWLDEMLEAATESRRLQAEILERLSQSHHGRSEAAGERAAARRRRPVQQTEELQEDEFADAYRRAREND